ncbi:MAG: tyrosine-type recombinase/integrase [Verrucomicrobia bacterium]|nr:tyrosine-type recombinase/integrase [Verrucomicrobiota bacterium]
MLDARKQPVRGLWVRKGRYYARLAIPDPDTGVTKVRRVPLEAAKTDAKARAALGRLRTQREDQDLPALREAPKLKDYVAEYFIAIKDTKRPGTITTERANLNAWIDQIGEVRLHHINRAMVNKFITRRLKAGANPRTVNLAVICLRNVLKRAIDDKWIKTLPTANLKPLKWKAKKRTLFADAQVEEICAAAFRPVFAGGELAKPGEIGAPLKNAQQFADFVRLLASCGSRMSETLRLKWSDVDWGISQLTVGSDGLAKNYHERKVDFNPRLKAHLIDMQTRRAPDSEWLFPSPQRGERDERAKSFRESLLLARAAAGLPEFGFHDCRHFFISMCVMSGIDYMTIARWVGHRDGGVLIGKVYGHLNDEHAKRQAQRICFQPSPATPQTDKPHVV